MLDTREFWHDQRRMHWPPPRKHSELSPKAFLPASGKSTGRLLSSAFGPTKSRSPEQTPSTRSARPGAQHCDPARSRRRRLPDTQHLLNRLKPCPTQHGLERRQVCSDVPTSPTSAQRSRFQAKQSPFPHLARTPQSSSPANLTAPWLLARSTERHLHQPSRMPAPFPS